VCVCVCVCAWRLHVARTGFDAQQRFLSGERSFELHHRNRSCSFNGGKPISWSRSIWESLTWCSDITDGSPCWYRSLVRFMRGFVNPQLLLSTCPSARRSAVRSPAPLAMLMCSWGRSFIPNVARVAVLMCVNVSYCWCAGGTVAPPIKVSDVMQCWSSLIGLNQNRSYLHTMCL